MKKEITFLSIKSLIIGISIIIGTLILSDGMERALKHDPLAPNSQFLHHERNPLYPINVKTNSDDVTYNSYLKVADGQKLSITLKSGAKREITGNNIKANFYHVGKLLVVDYQDKNGQQYIYMYEPIAWESIP